MFPKTVPYYFPLGHKSARLQSRIVLLVGIFGSRTGSLRRSEREVTTSTLNPTGTHKYQPKCEYSGNNRMSAVLCPNMPREQHVQRRHTTNIAASWINASMQENVRSDCTTVTGVTVCVNDWFDLV